MKPINLENMIDSMIEVNGEEATLFLLEHLNLEGFTDSNKELIERKIKELREVV